MIMKTNKNVYIKFSVHEGYARSQIICKPKYFWGKKTKESKHVIYRRKCSSS